jgi:hypothetical protein
MSSLSGLFTANVQGLGTAKPVRPTVEADDVALWDYLRRGGFSKRQQRLAACAFCRRGWATLTDPRSRHAVEVAERYADSPGVSITLAELRSARIGAYYAARQSQTDGARLAHYVVADEAAVAMEHAAHFALSSRGTAPSGWLRDLLGPPSEPADIQPAWLSWNDGIVLKLARAIYDEHTFDRLPVLADALEEAGCTDAVLLDHCRHPGEHARGCWLVDLLTGPWVR